MAENENELLSPTVKKVIDEFINVLRNNGKIDSQSIDSLDQLLQSGKIPKFDEIDEALFLPPAGEKS